MSPPAPERAGVGVTPRGEARDAEMGYATKVVTMWRERRFGIAWTDGKTGEEAKRSTTSWNKKAQAITGSLESAAAQFAYFITKRNPILVAHAINDPDAAEFVLIDCDGTEDLANFKAFDCPPTLTAQSSDPDKQHFIYLAPPGAVIHRIRFEGGGVGMDKNGYLVTPPALHPSGVKYRWLDRTVPTAVLPIEKYNAMVGHVKQEDKALENSLKADDGKKITEGGRHRYMLRLMGALRRYGIPFEMAIDIALEQNASKFDPPKPEHIITALVEDVYQRYEPVHMDDLENLPEPVQTRRPPARPGLDESSQADHLLRVLDKKARYIEEDKTWIAFKDHRWTRTHATAQVKDACIKAGKSLYADYGADIDRDHAPEGDVAYAEAAEKFSSQRAWRALRDNVVNIAADRALIPVDLLDQDQRLLGVGNGILDLRSYTLREGTPEDYVTVGTPVAYDPDAQAPLWLRFVDQVTCGDAELAAYLQCFFGYCLTAEVDDQQFHIWLGKSGGNGKDTFGNTIINVLGSDLGKEMAFSTIAATKNKRSGSEASSDLMALREVRFIKTTEPGRGQAVNEALVKQMTGKSFISARELHGRQQTFRLAGKLAILTNHPPELDVTDQGLRRRIVVVPWNAKFRTGENRDLHMEEHLAAEAEGILAWAVEGLKEYDRIGLDPSTCSAVEKATEEYLVGRNPLQAAVEAGYIELDPEAETPGAILRAALSDYFDSHPGVRRLADDELADALNVLEVTRRRTNKGIIWTGVRVRGAAS